MGRRAVPDAVQSSSSAPAVARARLTGPTLSPSAPVRSTDRPTRAASGPGREDHDPLRLVAREASRSTPRPAPSEQLDDQAAVELIKTLDRQSTTSPVSRRAIQDRLACGASRAARLAALARRREGARSDHPVEASA